MPDYLPKNELDPDDKKRVSNSRITIWVVVGAIGLYLIGTGIYGILTK